MTTCVEALAWQAVGTLLHSHVVEPHSAGKFWDCHDCPLEICGVPLSACEY